LPVLLCALDRAAMRWLHADPTVPAQFADTSAPVSLAPTRLEPPHMPFGPAVQSVRLDAV
jgi:hypothetical protein